MTQIYNDFHREKTIVFLGAITGLLVGAFLWIKPLLCQESLTHSTNSIHVLSTEGDRAKLIANENSTKLRPYQSAVRNSWKYKVLENDIFGALHMIDNSPLNSEELINERHEFIRHVIPENWLQDNKFPTSDIVEVYLNNGGKIENLYRKWESARGIVFNLPDSAEKVEFLGRLDLGIKVIDYYLKDHAADRKTYPDITKVDSEEQLKQKINSSSGRVSTTTSPDHDDNKTVKLEFNVQAISDEIEQKTHETINDLKRSRKFDFGSWIHFIYNLLRTGLFALSGSILAIAGVVLNSKISQVFSDLLNSILKWTHINTRSGSPTLKSEPNRAPDKPDAPD